ncbi:ATP-binding cassette domain-containing protein [Fluviispira vulneris]|uniref:ATP-binding cassette domain-containing protein n=1 Tax=Fluviispira vulneris TaxID=2763012 RepID=UPI0016443473|nr:ATP-binding cassette domain-containing protein [Fluviispira vulneris]
MSEKISFITQEERQSGKIGLGLYSKYLNSMQYLPIFLPIILILLVLTSLSESGFRYLVSLWANDCNNILCGDENQLKNVIRIWLQNADAYRITLFFFLFCLAAILLRAISWVVLMGFLANGARVLHNQMVESFSNVRVTFLDENPTGRLIRRFSGDYIQIKDEIPNIFSDIVCSIIELLIVSVIVLFQAPVAIIAVLPCIYFYYSVQSLFKTASREIQRYTKILETPIWSLFTETVVGFQTIRSYGKSKIFYDRLILLSHDYAKSVLLQSRILRWLNLRLKIISECFGLAVTLIAVILVAKNKIGVGEAGFLMSLTIGLDATMQWLTRSLSMIDSKMVSVERVIEYKNLPSEHIQFSHASEAIKADWPKYGEIIIENIQASYRKDLPIVLKNLNLKFEAGKKTGVIGRTGAGKSTLFQAFFRMLYLHTGKIIIDGIDITQISLEDARKVFAIVPQEPHLFSGTLKYNLDRTGKYSEEQMWEALKEVQLAKYIENLPEKLNYVLTERGHNFSVGQRQLICMARAILCNAKIILMDEATASVDLETEKLIQETLNTAFAHKTVIIIAHRLETLNNADHVVVLGNGQLVDYGTPAKILSKLGESLHSHLS